MKDLGQQAIRGGLAKISAQAANFVLRLGSFMILARLLGPKDFGLVGMVTAFTGVLDLLRDFGLSSAAVQRKNVTEEQISTLFWINILVGVLLGLLVMAMAPVIAAFYHEPRLLGVTIVLALGFVFNAAGVQHSAHLQRHMRFSALAIINTMGLSVGTGVAIAGALAGYGYKALVAMTVTAPLASTIGLWVAAAWIPGLPRRGVGIRSMMRFGGTITLNGLVFCIATNFDKILIGRFWGTGALGIYGRAYQLINIPTANLNTAAGEVAFAGLARVQDDPHRFKRYFSKGYSLVLALTVPITIACALFADDVTLVALGPKWKDSAAIFRLLAPTILVFAVIQPLTWLLESTGRVDRLLKIGLVMAPFMIGGYFAGLPYGPRGVAFAYSTVMTLSIIPFVFWILHGTVISPKDVLGVLTRPLASSVVAAGLAFGARSLWGHELPPLPRLILENAVLLAVFTWMLLFVTGQKSLYLDLVRGFRRPAPVTKNALASV